VTKTSSKGHARIAATPMRSGCRAAATIPNIAAQHAATTASVAGKNVGLRTALTIRRRAGSQSIAAAGDGLCPELPGIPARGNRSDGWTMATIEIEDRWEEKWAAKR
jgi:hypothetical protein